MREQGLLLAVRLWGRMPAELATQCVLLPAGAPPPPADFFTRTKRDDKHDASHAAAAFFSRAHLQARASCAVLCVHGMSDGACALNAAAAFCSRARLQARALYGTFVTHAGHER